MCALDSVATVRRLVAFYVDAHNRVLPHSAFRGQTPDEMYFGTATHSRQTWRHARPPRAWHACRPTERVLRDVRDTQRGRVTLEC